MACHQGYRSWEHLCVTKMKHSLTIWFCRDELSFAMLFWEDMIALISMLEVLLFLCQYELLSWIFRIWIFISQLRRFTLKLCQSITPHQKFFFIIYLLEDEQELSLGMLIRLQRIYNLWSIHAILLSILNDLYAFICYFIWFLGLTY